MNIVFISGVELGWRALKGIVDSDTFQRGEVVINAVFGLDEEKLSQTSGYQAFDDLAHSIRVPLNKVSSIRTASVVEQIRDYAPDFIFIIGWSELAPSKLLDIPKEKHSSKHRHALSHGSIGMHPSILPQGRGRAPIPWTIIKGLTRSGVTMFYLEEEADAGDIIARREFEVLFEDDASSIYTKVADLHYELMKDTLPILMSGRASRKPQDADNATVWKRRTPKDGVIDWNASHLELYNWIRALTHPYPGAYTFWRGRELIVWKAHLAHRSFELRSPGTVIDITGGGVVVTCSDGLLDLKQLQIPGKLEMNGETFAHHYGLQIGEKFGQ